MSEGFFSDFINQLHATTCVQGLAFYEEAANIESSHVSYGNPERDKIGSVRDWFPRTPFCPLTLEWPLWYTS